MVVPAALAVVGADSLFVSPDGGVNLPRDAGAIPTPAQCAGNRGRNIDRSRHFTTMEAAFRCAKGGESIVINAMNAAGTIVPYRELGFGYQAKPGPPSGSDAALTKVIGRCNQDVPTDNRSFKRESCKVVIRPQPADWGLTISASDRALANPADAGKSYFMTFQRADQHHVMFDNIEFDGSTGLLDPAGEWNGVNCQCLAGAFARIDAPASNFVFDHMNVHDSVGGSLYTFAATGGTEVNVLWQNSTSRHNGWNYLGSMLIRFGSIGGAPNCSTNPSISGCPEYFGEYYSHTHSFYLSAGGTTLRNNFIYDDAGFCVQLFNGSTYDTGRFVIDSNWFANCGWKSKSSTQTLNAVGGWNAQYAGGSKFTNNVFLNNVAGYVLNSPGIVIDNNLFVASSPSDDPSRVSSDVIEWDATRNAVFTGNTICFSRSNSGEPRDQMYVGNANGANYTPPLASIKANGDLGPTWVDTQERVFQSNSGNTFGGCAEDKFAAAGYSPRGGPPARDPSLTPGLLMSLIGRSKS
jgi:hypothetical protein